MTTTEGAQVQVPLDALRRLVEYADSRRTAADSQFNAGTQDDEASEREFHAVVDALGVEGLHD